MIGNLWEWTDEWYLGVDSNGVAHTWPGAGYGDDGTYDLSSGARLTTAVSFTAGVPTAGQRGGAWGDGAGAGIFAMDFDFAPSLVDNARGFRCVRRR